MYCLCVDNILRTLNIFHVLLSFVKSLLFGLHSFYWCPTLINADKPSPAMASKNSKAKVSLSPHVFFDDVVPEICIDTLCPLWCMTTAIFLEGFPRVQNPNQRYLLYFLSFFAFDFYQTVVVRFLILRFQTFCFMGFWNLDRRQWIGWMTWVEEHNS